MIKHQIPRAVLYTLMLSLAGGCGQQEVDRNEPVQDAALATIGQAEALKLWEGLPHHHNEAEALEQELAEKETFELHGHPFYAEPLELNDGDRAKLQEIVAGERFVKPFLNEKKCGGFHPDYAVQWTAGGEEYTLLLCFGCCEVKVVGPGGSTRYDIADDDIYPLLRAYRNQRPEPYSPGAK